MTTTHMVCGRDRGPRHGGFPAGFAPVLGSTLAALLGVLAVSPGIYAQEQPAVGSAPTEASGTTGQQPGEAAAPARFLRVAVDEVELRAFQTEQSPAYGEHLVEGDVVRLAGGRDGGFVPVQLPLGVAGYVHRDFVEVGADGVMTTTAKVMFRIAPNAGMVEVIDRGHRLRLLAEDGDWLRVRDAERIAWVPESAVQELEGSAAAASWSDLAARQEAELQAVVQARIEADARRQMIEQLTGEAAALQGRIDAARAEQLDAAGWQMIVAETVVYEQRVQEELGDTDGVDTGGLVARAAALRSAAEHAGKVQEIAETLAAPEPPIAPRVEMPKPAPNPMQRFTGAGWVRVEAPILFGETVVRIQRGARPLYNLVCTSGRYDLTMFRDLEIGVVGDLSRPDPEGVRVLDVRRIEVLNSSQR